MMVGKEGASSLVFNKYLLSANKKMFVFMQTDRKTEIETHG